MTRDATSQSFFEEMYRRDPDPWRFASSPYEQSRYEVIAAALKDSRYKRGFEPGCAIGMLTTRLARLCDQVESIDISPTAVAQARKSCENLPNVSIHPGSLPSAVPAGDFDLIVLSEIGYYFCENDLLQLGQDLLRKLRLGGTLLATHWLGVSEDHLLSGDRVHEILGSFECLALTHSEPHPGFRMDRWKRV